jgi:hypothetical protein
LQEQGEIAQAVGTAIGDAFDNMGNRMVDSMGFAQTGMEGFVGGMMKAAVKIIGILLAESISQAIASASDAAMFTGPAAVMTLPAFIATSVGSVMAAFAAIPKFAAGGLAYGPTLAVIGEYPGAASNPEVVGKLSDIKGMVGNGGVTVVLQGSLEMDNRNLRVKLAETDYRVSRIR